MNLLLVRLSSRGDVLHTLPALTDMRAAHPDWKLDWLIEPGFGTVAAWHPAVGRVLPFSLRRFKGKAGGLVPALWALRRELRSADYGAVLDSQGLYKSALLARLAGRPVWGLDRQSAREPGATHLYARRFAVPWGRPGIQRNRELFAAALGYPLPQGPADYGLGQVAEGWRAKRLPPPWEAWTQTPFVLGFHATSRAWENKEWPVSHWQALAQRLGAAGFRLLLPAVDEREQARVASIAKGRENVVPLPSANLQELAQLMVRAEAFVGMDTGLSFVAAAMGLSGVTLYGPTVTLQGILDNRWPQLRSAEPCAPCGAARCQRRDRAPGSIPCQESLVPDQVWAKLQPLLTQGARNAQH